MSSTPPVIAEGTVTYQGPTDTHGSRHIVRWKQDGKRKQRTVGYNYAARDAAVDAIVTAFPAQVRESVALVQRGQTTTSDFTLYAW